MNLARHKPDPQWDEKVQRVLDEIIELKEQLNALPESNQFERYPHLHIRMDNLINTYMQLLNSRKH